MILATLLLIAGPDLDVAEPGYEHDCLAQPMQDFELRLTASDITSAVVGFSERSNEPVLNIAFSESGQERFTAVQQGRIGKKFALCFEGHLLSTPILNEYISGKHAQITGGWTLKEITELRDQMNKDINAP